MSPKAVPETKKKVQPKVLNPNRLRDVVPERVEQKVSVSFKLVAPDVPGLDFHAELSPETRFRDLEEMIRIQHDRSILDVFMCVDRYHPDEVVRKGSCSLADKGVTSGNCTIFYDYKPVMSALLA